MSMTREVLRQLYGPEKFDKAVEAYKNRESELHPPAVFNDLQISSTPGITIEEGRQALSRAAKRSYKLS